MTNCNIKKVFTWISLLKTSCTVHIADCGTALQKEVSACCTRIWRYDFLSYLQLLFLTDYAFVFDYAIMSSHFSQGTAIYKVNFSCHAYSYGGVQKKKREPLVCN